MQVKEIMATDLSTCRAEDSLQRAAQLMWEGDIGCVPVVDEERRVVGMITDRDICMTAYTQGSDLASRTVAGAMSPRVYTCTATESVAVAHERMRQQQIRRLPVVTEGRLVGLLSLNDLAVAAGNRKGSKSGGAGLEEVATTLFEICQSRQIQKHAMAAQ